MLFVVLVHTQALPAMPSSFQVSKCYCDRSRRLFDLLIYVQVHVSLASNEAARSQRGAGSRHTNKFCKSRARVVILDSSREGRQAFSVEAAFAEAGFRRIAVSQLRARARARTRVREREVS